MRQRAWRPQLKRDSLGSHDQVTDGTHAVPQGWSRHLLEARILACVAIVAAVAWFGGQVIWSREVAGSLAIALLWSLSSALRDIWVYRQGWRGAFGLGLLILVLTWPLLWLGFTYRARHP